MMKQYFSIKRNHKDAVLFFRLGDFYEMFHQDAHEISAILGLTLTKRHGIPMCGIPYHASQTYIGRLLKAGKKIAICEQTKMPEGGKGIAEREVVEIITPGTIVDEDFLDKSSNNYLIALGGAAHDISLAWVDLSTGEFSATSFPWKTREERLAKELARLSPREAVVQDSLFTEDDVTARLLSERDGLLVNRFPDWSFDADESRDRLKRLFGVENLKAFGISDATTAVYSCGVLLEYLEDSSKHVLSHLRGIRIVSDGDYVGLDESTQKNLELVRNLQDGSKRYSLLEVLDFTRTAMGARKLRSWILHPLRDLNALGERLSRVASLYHDQQLLGELRNELGELLDLERLSTRVAMDKAHAKDLLAIGATLKGITKIDTLLERRLSVSSILPSDDGERRSLSDCISLLDHAIHEEPSILLTEGKLIRDGYDSELDELRALRKNSREVLDAYLEKERRDTGIPTLKIRFNKIIGYFLEVTKSNLHLVPEHFIRRQSLVGGERFTTDRLIELETNLNTAADRIIELEKDLFLRIRENVKTIVPLFQNLCARVSTLDCLQSFAYASTKYGYVKPDIENSAGIRIVSGRHPVVEAHLPAGSFVPNSIDIENGGGFFALITGPNMAGKSTFLRQTALIVLMAQIGCFVPADEAHIGLVDQIFCRVGASDNLARGESTFLVEMNETAHILRTATEKSLVIMDEVGRGTSTNDGLSIAWAVTEYILETLRAKTLFATHYHELTALDHPSIRNLSMEVSERGSEIVFLKRVKEGPSNNSYGIHVAKLAGLPAEVVSRAGVILAHIESSEKNLPGARQSERMTEVPEPESGAEQTDLFSPAELIGNEILSLKIDHMTPLQALETIDRWKKELQNDGRSEY